MTTPRKVSYRDSNGMTDPAERIRVALSRGSAYAIVTVDALAALDEFVSGAAYAHDEIIALQKENERLQRELDTAQSSRLLFERGVNVLNEWHDRAMVTAARCSRLKAALREADNLLRRLSGWDVLNLPPGSGDDGAYWRIEITHARGVAREALTDEPRRQIDEDGTLDFYGDVLPEVLDG